MPRSPPNADRPARNSLLYAGNKRSWQPFDPVHTRRPPSGPPLQIAMASLFRIFAFALPDLEAAQTAPGPIVSVQVIFAGFLVTFNNMGWLQ
jgi:hypothetical protein